MPILIRKVREEYGWLGNMSHHPVKYAGNEWKSAEALFQAMRFTDSLLILQLMREGNPMKAKMIAKSCADRMKVKPRSAEDLDNMRKVIRAKLETNPDLEAALVATGHEQIIEDCSNRRNDSGLFWGACNVEGEWVGLNWLGRLWMELRPECRRIAKELK